MRVILDTNILISALLSPSGPPGRIYSTWRAGLFEVVGSQDLLDEVSVVLARPKMRNYVTMEEAASFVSDLAATVEIVSTESEQGGRAPDPGDDFLLDLVDAAIPDLLVTGDKALLDLVSIGTTLVVTAAELGLVLEELPQGT